MKIFRNLFLATSLLAVINVVKANDIAELAAEVKSCISSHSLQENTCATLMQIKYMAPQSPFTTLTAYNDDGKCNSPVLAMVTLNKTNSFEENEKLCKGFALKIKSGNRAVWGIRVNNKCQDIPDISNRYTDDLEELCLSKL